MERNQSVRQPGCAEDCWGDRALSAEVATTVNSTDWTEIGYRNGHFTKNCNGVEIKEGQRDDGGTNSTLRVKEQPLHLTL